jgi:hypothetical protein
LIADKERLGLCAFFIEENKMNYGQSQYLIKTMRPRSQWLARALKAVFWMLLVVIVWLFAR